MDTLIETLATVLGGYAGHDLNGDSFLTQSSDRTVMTVISVGDVRGQHFAVANLVARIADGRIVIEHDIHDKPLVDALLEAGVSRQRIVLAYAGESGSHAA